MKPASRQLLNWMPGDSGIVASWLSSLTPDSRSTPTVEEAQVILIAPLWRSSTVGFVVPAVPSLCPPGVMVHGGAADAGAATATTVESVVIPTASIPAIRLRIVGSLPFYVRQ